MLVELPQNLGYINCRSIHDVIKEFEKEKDDPFVLSIRYVPIGSQPSGRGYESNLYSRRFFYKSETRRDEDLENFVRRVISKTHIEVS